MGNPNIADFVPSDDDMDRARVAAEQIGQVAQKLGLYQEGYEIGCASRPDAGGDDELRMVVISMFAAGEVAFSDRVLNPAEADLDDEFIVIKNELEAQDFEAYRQGLEDKLKGDDSDG